jgi:hypothetical protein
MNEKLRILENKECDSDSELTGFAGLGLHFFHSGRMYDLLRYLPKVI